MSKCGKCFFSIICRCGVFTSGLSLFLSRALEFPGLLRDVRRMERGGVGPCDTE